MPLSEFFKTKNLLIIKNSLKTVVFNEFS